MNTFLRILDRMARFMDRYGQYAFYAVGIFCAYGIYCAAAVGSILLVMAFALLFCGCVGFGTVAWLKGEMNDDERR